MPLLLLGYFNSLFKLMSTYHRLFCFVLQTTVIESVSMVILEFTTSLISAQTITQVWYFLVLALYFTLLTVA